MFSSSPRDAVKAAVYPRSSSQTLAQVGRRVRQVQGSGQTTKLISQLISQCKSIHQPLIRWSPGAVIWQRRFQLTPLTHSADFLRIQPGRRLQTFGGRAKRPCPHVWRRKGEAVWQSRGEGENPFLSRLFPLSSPTRWCARGAHVEHGPPLEHVRVVFSGSRRAPKKRKQKLISPSLSLSLIRAAG